MPSVGVNNFTTDWNDGTMIAQLVDAHAPGLCPEYATMDPSQPLENAQYAMGLAEEWLGVPQVCNVVCFVYCSCQFVVFNFVVFVVVFITSCGVNTLYSITACL